jgi:glycosyltransferase involved in cell wall biosynthesis
MKKTRVLIQGWRGINHSYALVNQYQLLEPLKREDLALFHEDLPYAGKDWNRAQNHNGFVRENTDLLDAIAPPDGGDMDVTYRIAFPYRVHGGNSRKIFCYGTCESRPIKGDHIYSGPEAHQRYANNKTEIVTPSHWSKKGFVRSGFRDEAVHIVPNAVDVAIFHPLPKEAKKQARVQLGIPPDKFAFLNVGAMTANKGIDILLLAFGEIHEKYPHSVLLLKDLRNLYGQSAQGEIANVKRQFPGRLASAALRAIGVVPDSLDLQELCSLYNSSDAYISPYRAEGFALTPLEAAACGVPVAVTAGGGTDDYAQPSFALKIASKPESDGPATWQEPELDSVIACMETLIEKRGAELNPAQGTAWIAENFSWTKAVDKLAALFTA